MLTKCRFSFRLGIVLIVNASEDFEHTEEIRNEKPREYVETEEAIDISLIIGGIFLTLFGFVLIALYIKYAEWRRHCICPCGLSKKQGLARQLQSGTGGTQLPLNPSTDPLVSHTQYAPVSELPRPDDEECRTLMTDNKDWYVFSYYSVYLKLYELFRFNFLQCHSVWAVPKSPIGCWNQIHVLCFDPLDMSKMLKTQTRAKRNYYFFQKIWQITETTRKTSHFDE